eukprot:5102803-Alexandrium_andersonii.AAC.1
MLRPWVLLMRGTHAIPRAMADDMHLATMPHEGRDEVQQMEFALESTFDYLERMGARAQPSKSRITA